MRAGVERRGFKPIFSISYKKAMISGRKRQNTGTPEPETIDLRQSIQEFF